MKSSGNQLINNKIEYDNLLFCVLISFSEINSLFTGIIRSVVGNTRSLDTVLLYLLVALLIFKWIPGLKLRISKVEIIAIMVYALMWMYSFLYGFENLGFLANVVIRAMRNGLLLWVVIRRVHITPKMIVYLRVTAYVIILGTIINTMFFSSGDLAELYSQYEGYQLSTGFLLLILPATYSRWKIDYVVGFLTITLTLMTGARGPLIVEVVALLASIVFVNREKKRLWKVLLPTTVLATLALIYINNIMLFFLRIADGMGFSTRSINTILKGDFFSYLSGRDVIAEHSLKYISNHLLYGCGFGNDRMIIAQAMGQIDGAMGLYPHNIILEILMQFGVIVGIFVLLGILVLVVRTFKQIRNREERFFYIIIVIAAVVPLMFSGSYITFGWFYCLLGYSFSRLNS